MYVYGLGANIFDGMNHWTIRDETKQTAEAFMAALKDP